MADPLDDVRRALGLPPLSAPSSSQEAGAPGSAASPWDAAAQAHDARARAHEDERRRLAEAGDDADGLDEVRQAFRRAGRG